jgi:hypothetical protein
MPTTRLQFTEWLPDQPANAGSLIDAKNVFPVSVGYSPFPNAVDFSGAASENLNSVYAAKFGSEVVIFAGGASKLFKFNAATEALEDKSLAGGYTGTSTWNFALFGAEVLATNHTAKVQRWTIGSSTAFADLAAAAPIAKFVTVVRDFVVCANIGSTANKVQWSDINDATDWVSGTTSQSDFQIMPDGGNITGITGGEFGIVFLEKAIARMSYTGSPLFFQFDTISRGLGCIAGGSIAQYGGLSFFLSDDGFYQTDGQSVTGIGNEKVDKYFFDDVLLESIDSMSSSADPKRKIVVWNYANNSGGRSILIYNWQLQRWSRASTAATVVGDIATAGTTLEGLGTLGYTDIDTMPASLDARLWVGGKFLFAGAEDTKIVTFTGSDYNSELITTDVEVGYNSVVTLARPQIDNGSATIKIASRRELDDAVIFGDSSTTSAEGRADLRSAGRYHRLEVSPTGNWTTAMAVDIDVKPQGNR